MKEPINNRLLCYARKMKEGETDGTPSGPGKLTDNLKERVGVSDERYVTVSDSTI